MTFVHDINDASGNSDNGSSGKDDRKCVLKITKGLISLFPGFTDCPARGHPVEDSEALIDFILLILIPFHPILTPFHPILTSHSSSKSSTKRNFIPFTTVIIINLSL